jgi:predicted nucleic-acid-binding protein
MIGLDTNVVLRYLVQDDFKQAEIANRIFEKELSASNKGHICPIVLCETIWVLLRSYKQEKKKIVEVVRTMLLTENIEIEHRDSVWKALRDFETGDADFSDYLIAHINHECGTSATLTFDRTASAHRLFRLAK